MTVRRIAALALVVAVSIGGTAAAQTDAPPPASAEPAPAVAAPPGQAAVSKLEKRIASLYRRLRITPAQQAQWDGFMVLMRENLVHTEQLAKARAEAGGKTALENLRALAAAAQLRAADVQRLVPAFEALYGAMSPEQQKLADTAMRDFIRRGTGRS